MARRTATAIALSLWLVGTPALAQRDPGAAEALFQDAKAALARRELDVACAKFRESHELDPAVGTLFNLADCEEQRGKLGTAWALFIEVRQTLERGDEREGQVNDRIKALEPRLSRLTVRLGEDAPARTRVTRNGVVVGPGSLGAAVVVDPGKQEVVAEAEGHEPGRVSLEIAEGKSDEVIVAPGKKKPGDIDPPAEEGMTLHPIGLSLLGLGLAGVGVGIGLGVAAKGNYEDAEARCPNNVCDQQGFDERSDAITLSHIGTGVFIGGIVVGAAGLVIEIVELAGGAPEGDSAWNDALRGRWRF